MNGFIGLVRGAAYPDTHLSGSEVFCLLADGARGGRCLLLPKSLFQMFIVRAAFFEA